jgi:prepilin-type N-terminal cleavage/methylation domain-containing protein
MSLSGKKGKRGFTMIEAMISVGLLSILSVGIFTLLKNGNYMWQMGSARIALESESRVTMLTIRKLITQCQGATIAISRYDTGEPVNSYIEAIIAEQVYITTTQSKCGCAGQSSSTTTVGAAGSPIQLFQYGSHLLAVYPQVLPGTDMTNNSAVTANTYYTTVTLTANLDSISFDYADSKDATVINVGARFSKWVFAAQPPLTVFTQETIVVKRMHSAGYYYN